MPVNLSLQHILLQTEVMIMPATSQTQLKSAADAWWPKLFLEVALRAIRRVHCDYGTWQLGHVWRREDAQKNIEPQQLNLGKGIEIAPEIAVCAEICSEFLASQLVNGVVLDQTPRYWQIDREQQYQHDPDCHVDICVRRYERNGNQLSELLAPGKGYPIPAYIEVKRARRWKIRLEDGTVKREDNTASEVAYDADKLFAEIEHLGNAKAPAEIYGHVLVYGPLDQKTPLSDTPNGFFRKANTLLRKLRKDDKRTRKTIIIKPHHVRWLPLSWKDHSIKPFGKKFRQRPTVDRWLWLAIAEVHPG